MDRPDLHVLQREYLMTYKEDSACYKWFVKMSCCKWFGQMSEDCMQKQNAINVLSYTKCILCLLLI